MKVGTAVGCSSKALLTIKGLWKSYAGPVLRGVDLEIRSGEVHALVGANGAGKTTLARIVAGLTASDGGEMRLEGARYEPSTKNAAEDAGVQLVMQELNLLPTLSLAENLYLNRLPRRAGWIDFRRLHASARRDLEAVGLGAFDPGMPAASLGVGEQQMVEIAAALSRHCRLLILDEPTSALTDPQVDLLFDHVRRLREAGAGVLYVSHRLEELRRIADRATVLRDGQVVATVPPSDVSVSELVRLMAGRDVEAGRRAERRPAPGPVALEVRSLETPGVESLDLEVHRGEILGLAGLVGAGRTEALRAIYGAEARTEGTIRVDGRAVDVEDPADAVRAGIGLVPEDRKAQGLLLTQPVRVNLTLADLGRVSRWGWLDLAAESELTRRLLASVETDYASEEQAAAELSGGNQQKLVLARWLLRDCPVLLLDEPTRGVDVAARRTVHRLLEALTRRGKALVVVSSDLRELMEICDRIAVLSAGRLVRTFERGQCTHDALLEAAVSGHLSGVGDDGETDQASRG